MESTVLDDIPFRADLAQLLKRLRIDTDSDDAEKVAELARQAEAVARPKALYRPAFIEAKEENQVVIDGVKLTSRVLRVNLDQAHRVFAYVATCGLELDQWSNGICDLLQRYWADAIKEMALRAAIQQLEAHVAETFKLGATARMNPGSLADWPISQQRPLFAILGDPRRQIGVELTESFLMLPVKSVSGLRFPTEVTFESCQLCPREGCPGRRAAYDAGLYDRRYRA